MLYVGGRALEAFEIGFRIQREIIAEKRFAVLITAGSPLFIEETGKYHVLLSVSWASKL